MHQGTDCTESRQAFPWDPSQGTPGKRPRIYDEPYCCDSKFGWSYNWESSNAHLFKIVGTVKLDSLHDLHTHHLLHRTGGIIPIVAAALHRENLERVTQLALERSGIEVDEVLAIAVTMGPGLATCLSEGVAFAKELARKAR